ncbi:MAG: ABC transporter ATP-binding protein, partial [bacterium]
MGKPITVENLWFAHKSFPVLKEISFEVEEGEIYTVLGPNGAGKSTLFRCLLGAWKAQQGKISLFGKELFSIPLKERAKLISFVPQEHIPSFPFSVLEFVAMGFAPYLSAFHSPSKKDYEKALAILQDFHLDYLKDKPYHRISGGESRLVFLARAIVQDTPLLLLDEPTAHLDYRNQTLILQKIRQIASSRGKTILMCMHDPTLASIFSDKVILLKKGEIKKMGKPDDV